MTENKTFKIQSKNDKSKIYTVQILDDGLATCNCKHWQFRSNNNLRFMCKHIKEVMETNDKPAS